MRRQFCSLPPGRAAARCMSDRMLRANVKGWHTHWAAMRQTEMSDLHQAHQLRTSDLIGMATPSLRLQRIQAASDTGPLALFINLPRGDKHRSRRRLRAAQLAAPLQGLSRSAPGFP